MTPNAAATISARRTKRLAEAVCGGIAAPLGGGGLAFALFSDSMVSVQGSVTTSGVPLCARAPCPQATVPTLTTQTFTHTSIAANQGISGSLEVFTIAVIVVLLVIALGAVMHGITTRVPWLVLLCMATGLMLLATLLTGFSIGLFFIPSDALAIGAVALGLTQVGPAPQPVIFPGR